MKDYAVVGKSVERTDARIKVSGSARYAADLIAPGMLHGKILRSPLAHAKIVSIDTSRAQALPGVMGVITGKDFPGIPFGTRPDNGTAAHAHHESPPFRRRRGCCRCNRVKISRRKPLTSSRSSTRSCPWSSPAKTR